MGYPGGSDVYPLPSPSETLLRKGFSLTKGKEQRNRGRRIQRSHITCAGPCSDESRVSNGQQNRILF